MRITSRILQGVLATAVLVALCAPVHAQDRVLDMASRLIEGGDYDKAIELLDVYTQKNPENGPAWATLANAYHLKGDYENALLINRRAARFAVVRTSALYNEACALSLMGRVDEAKEMLDESLTAGFLDFDLLETDPDLDALRERHPIDLPKKQEYETFKARNGVEIRYRVLLPEKYDAAEAYPAVVLFSPGAGPRAVDWVQQELVGAGDERGSWIVIFPVVPEEGWYTHPSHHAFNDLLRRLSEDYNIEGGKYHAAGFASGATVATTYARISSNEFQTLTCFSGWHWQSWEESDLAGAFVGMPVRLVVGADDEFGRPLNERMARAMSWEDIEVGLKVLGGDGRLLESMRHGAILEYLPRLAALLKDTY